MSKVGIVAVARPAFGGTFQYTLSMIEALRTIATNEYTLYTTWDNSFYDDLPLPVIRLPGALAAQTCFAAKRGLGLSKMGLFSDVDKVVAPIYTSYLLASSRPFAFTIHDLQEKYYPQYFSLAQRLWRHATGSLLARSAGRVICESNHVKKDICRFYGVDDRRVAVVPAPPVSSLSSVSCGSEALAAVKAVLQLPDVFLFYPAQFWPHKNHLRLVEAFAQITQHHPQCGLVLTGRVRGEFEAVMLRAQQLGVMPRIKHLGHLETEDLAAVYRLATLVVVPTLFESVSLPVYEAFIAGTPVCASNVVALPEQIGDAGVLFDPTSPRDMAEKISALLRDPGLRKELAVRGRRRMEGFSLASYAKRLDDLLGNL